MKNFLKHLQFAVSILYFPLVLIFTLFTETNDGDGSHYALVFVICILYTFPFFCAMLELCATVLRILEKDKPSKGRLILYVIRTALAAGILVTLVDHKKLLYVALVLSLMLCATWVISLLTRKKEERSRTEVKRKPVLISCAVAIGLILIAAIILSAVTDRKNRGELTPSAEASDVIYSTFTGI